MTQLPQCPCLTISSSSSTAGTQCRLCCVPAHTHYISSSSPKDGGVWLLPTPAGSDRGKGTPSCFLSIPIENREHTGWGGEKGRYSEVLPIIQPAPKQPMPTLRNTQVVQSLTHLNLLMLKNKNQNPPCFDNNLVWQLIEQETGTFLKRSGSVGI